MKGKDKNEQKKKDLLWGGGGMQAIEENFSCFF